MQKKVRWGILGCAQIAFDRVIPGLLMAPNAELYAIASRGPAKLGRFQEAFQPVKAYDIYDALIADKDVEAVYIPLPNSMHYEWVFKAAKAGKHILCEKPLALDEKQAREMYENCEQNGVLLMEAFAYRHAPLVQKTKQLIEQGIIGKVKFVESQLTCVLENMQDIRMNKELGGGAFYDVGCYNINLISYLLGEEPVEIKAFAEMNEEHGVDISNTAILKYANGVQAFSYSAMNSYPRGGYTVVGEKGRIEVPCNFNCRDLCKLILTKNGKLSNVEVIGEERTEMVIQCPNNYMLEVEQLGNCILNGDKPYVSKEETLRNIRIMDRIFKAL